jgi:thioredoxin 1
MTRYFKSVAITAISTLALFANAVFAGPFTQADFDKAVADGKSVVVEFHADWCPTCKKQAPIVKEIAADPAYKNFVFLTADYDKEVELKKKHNVTKQSTFVVFKGGKEVARSTGQTAKADIAGTFAKAM